MTNPTNVSDDQIAMRSVMMRIYHSRIAGEAYYPEQMVNGAAPGLEANGWIERRGAGWRMTEDGVKAWAKMCAPIIASKYRQTDQNEMMFYLGRPIRRIALTKDVKGILQMMVESGGELPLKTLYAQFGRSSKVQDAVNGLKSLMNAVYVLSDGETVTMTDVGWMVATEMGFEKKDETEMLEKKLCVVTGCFEPRMPSKGDRQWTRCDKHQREYWAEQARKQRMKNDVSILVEASKAIRAEDAGKNNPSPSPSPLRKLVERGTSAAECEDCGGCVHREVVEMLKAKYPQVGELVQVMTRARELRDDLGI